MRMTWPRGVKALAAVALLLFMSGDSTGGRSYRCRRSSIQKRGTCQ